MIRFLFGFIFHTVATATVFWSLQNIILINQFTISSDRGLYFGLVLIAIVFGFMNTLLKPLLKIITLPLRLITLGLISFFINALIIYLLELVLIELDVFNTTLVITNISSYIVAGIILSITNTIIHWIR